MKFIEYNFNLGVYDNVKNDIIVKTNWGNKFKRYFKKHSQLISSKKVASVKSGNAHPFAYVPTPNEPMTAVYEFKNGMSYLLKNDDLPEFELQEKTTLIDNLKNVCSIYDGSEYSTQNTLTKSYFAVRMTNTTQVDDEDDSCTIDGWQLAISAGEYARAEAVVDDPGTPEDESQEADLRYKSRRWRYGNVVDDTSLCYLEPIEDESDLSGIVLSGQTGVEYSPYITNTLSPNFENIFDMFGVEDITLPLHESVDVDLTAIKDNLNLAIKDYILECGAWDSVDWENETTAVFVFSVAQFLNWVELYAASLGDYIYEYTNNRTRLEDDVKLLDHVGIIDNLKEEIDSDKRMRYIWIALQKQADVSPQTISYQEEYTYEIAGVEYTGTRTITAIDPAWEWWMLDEFTSVRRNFHKFYLHCDAFLIDGKLSVVVKDSFLELTGKRVYDLVGFFLDVDAYIVPKKKKWYEKLLSFILFVFGIILTLMSASPAWLKLVIIANSVMEYTGNGSLVFSAITAILSLGYNLYTVDFGSMSTIQTFDFAMSNINSVVKIYGMYSQMGLIDLQNELEQLKSSAKTTDEMIEYIYTYAYSQYDDMYNMLYNYNPKYAYEEA